MRFFRWLGRLGLVSLLPVCAMAGPLAQFRTALGEIDVELYDQDKPATVQNFIRYVQSGLYTNMFIHRWAAGFVIQGGGFFTTNRYTTNATIVAIPTFGTIPNEYSVGRRFSNQYGTIAMARQSGLTNSATSQWFFNLTNNSFLDSVDGGFTVFGRAVSGTNVLERFNNTTATNKIYLVQLDPPLDTLPVLSANPTYEDLVYVDITLLNVHVSENATRQKQISWQSVSNKVNRVEFTTQTPPVWQTLVATNGTGGTISVTDPQAADRDRFYRVRVDY